MRARVADEGAAQAEGLEVGAGAGACVIMMMIVLGCVYGYASV